MNPTGSKVNGGSQQNGFSARGALTGDLTREKAAHQSPVGPRDPHLNQLWQLGGARCRRALTCTGLLIAPPAVAALNPQSPAGARERLPDVTWRRLAAVLKPGWEDGEVRRRPSVHSKVFGSNSREAAAERFSTPLPSPSIAPCRLPTLQSSTKDSLPSACFHFIVAQMETTMCLGVKKNYEIFWPLSLPPSVLFACLPGPAPPPSGSPAFNPHINSLLQISRAAGLVGTKANISVPDHGQSPLTSPPTDHPPLPPCPSSSQPLARSTPSQPFVTK